MKLAPGSSTNRDRDCQLLPEKEGDLRVLICKWVSSYLIMKGNEVPKCSIPPALLPDRRGSAFPGLGTGNTNRHVGLRRFWDWNPHTWIFFLGSYKLRNVTFLDPRSWNPTVLTDSGAQLSRAVCGSWLQELYTQPAERQLLFSDPETFQSALLARSGCREHTTFDCFKVSSPYLRCLALPKKFGESTSWQIMFREILVMCNV